MGADLLIPGRESITPTLLERAEEVAQAGSWEWDLATKELFWSDNLYRIFGLEPGEITPTPEYVAERTHVDDRDRVERVLEEAREHGQLRPVEYRIVRADGTVRHLRAMQAVVELHGGRRQKLVGSVQDATDWRDAERQVAAHVAVSESLAQWETFEQGIVELLRNLAEALDCLAGVMWAPQDDELAPRALWHSRSTDATKLKGELRTRTRRRRAGLPSSAWQTKEPQISPSLASGGDGETKKGALTGLVAIPALYRDEVLAVLEFYYGEPSRPEVPDALYWSLAGLGYELGHFLSHHRGELSPSVLTPRELEVLQLAAQGRTAPEIAELLVVSPSTVTTHLRNVYGKYGVSDRASAVAKALREGLIE